MIDNDDDDDIVPGGHFDLLEHPEPWWPKWRKALAIAWFVVLGVLSLVGFAILMGATNGDYVGAFTFVGGITLGLAALGVIFWISGWALDVLEDS